MGTERHESRQNPVTPATDVIPFEAASAVWEQLSAAVGHFVTAWEEGATTPSIADHLATVPEAQRRMTAIELIKIDLEYRWLKIKQPRHMEEYLAEFSFLARDVPVDLLYEEYHVRRQAGETAPPLDLLKRFPEQAGELKRLLGSSSVAKSTTLVKHGPRRSLNLKPGDQIDDFDLLARLGEGAFGDVFLARQRSMQRTVALKVTADKGAEPQTLAQLDHENIVRVFDQRLLPDNGLRLMYMQYAAGGTLSSIVEKLRSIPPAERTGADYLRAIDEVLLGRGEDPPAESPLRTKLAGMHWPQVVCWLGARLARALDYAHHIGVLHRDVKPANVLLTAEGSPKLADFNISFSSKLDGATPAAYFGGSLAYMSPEQLEACNPAHDRTPADLDGRSDLYSLGVMLWELLTGYRPFEDEQVERSWGLTLEQMTMRRRRGVQARLLVGLVRDDAPGLDQALARCLASETAERFGDGTEMARHFELCLHPQTQRLLIERDDFWHRFVTKYPELIVIVLTVAPNAFAGALNYLYNHAEIVLRLEGADVVFQRVQTFINFVFFPLGGLYGYWRAHAVARYIRDPKARRALDDWTAADLRRRCLFMGNEASMVGLWLWVAAGFAYPIAMHVGLGDVPWRLYSHFFTSLILCGLIAAAYPFLLITIVSLHNYYPLFVRLASMNRRDREHLANLRRLGWIYLGIAALVPMAAVATLVLIGSQAQLALGMMAVGGIVGFVMALFGLRTFQADYDALIVTTQHQPREKLPSLDETLR